MIVLRSIFFITLTNVVFSCDILSQVGTLRTDGVYIFDNGIDTVIQSPIEVLEMAQRYTLENGIEVKTNLPCEMDGIIAAPGSMFLSMLVFFADTTGRASNLGPCRDSDYIRDKALFILQRQANGDTSKIAKQHSLYDLSIGLDSSITFIYSSDHYLKERYWGKSYGNVLELKMERVAYPGEITNNVRTYKFYSYEELFRRDFIYKKPTFY